MNLDDRLQTDKNLMDGWLDTCCQQGHPLSKALREAMRYSLLAGGKRLRPALFMETLRMLGKDPVLFRHQAVALEMIHTFTLIHDDLPCMDDDDLRRGRATCHKRFGEDLALLAGDALVFQAFEWMASGDQAATCARSLRAIRLLSEAIGPRGVIAGQVADIKAAAAQGKEDTLHYIHQHKTADFLSVCAHLGAVLGDGDPQTCACMAEYGKHLGLAFQIVDDLLDIRGDEAVLGKPVGSDEAAGKLTWPALYGVEASERRAREESQRALRALDRLENLDASFFRALCAALLERAS